MSQPEGDVPERAFLPSLAPQRHFPTVDSLQERSQQIVREFHRENGPVDDLVALYNHWVFKVIKDQIASKQLIFGDGSRITFEVPEQVGEQNNPLLPHRNEGGRTDCGSAPLRSVALEPAEAIAQNLTYRFDLYVTATRVAGDEPPAPLQRGRRAAPARGQAEKCTFKLGSIPAMVGSDVCWTRRLPIESLREEAGRFRLTEEELGAYEKRERVEALLDQMGLDRSPFVSYFIIKGKPYVVLLNEKIRMNTFVTYFEKKPGRYITSMKCSTNAGSLQVRVAMYAKGKKGSETAYVMELLSTSALKKRAKERVAGGMDYVKGGKGVEVLAESRPDEKRLPPFVNIFHIFDIFGWPELDEADAEVDSAKAILEGILQFVSEPFRERARSVLASTLMDFRSAHLYPRGSQGFFQEKLNVSGQASRQEIRAILRDDLFTQISPQTVKADAALSPEEEAEADRRRMQMMAYMAARHVMIILGGLKPEDKNSWANNFLFSAGKVMEVHFSLLWSDTVSRIQKQIKEGSVTPGTQLSSIATQLAKGDSILSAYEHAFETKKWDSFSRTTLATTLVEPLRDETYDSVLSQLSVVNVKVHRRTRDRELRQIQPSQAGYFCPAQTPERGPCGLVKHRSMGCRLSLEDASTREKVLRALVMGDLALRWRPLYAEKADSQHSTMLVINGIIEGWCKGQEAADRLRFMRRRHAFLSKQTRGDSFNLAFDTLVVYTRDAFLRRYEKPVEFSEDILYVYSDGGRPVRPLFIVDPAEGQLMMDVQEDPDNPVDYWSMTFGELLEQGCIEYVDAWEHEINCYVAEGAWYMAGMQRQLEEARKNLNKAKRDYEAVKINRREALEAMSQDIDAFLSALGAESTLAAEYYRNEERILSLREKLAARSSKKEELGVWLMEEELDKLEERNLRILGRAPAAKDDKVAEEARSLESLTSEAQTSKLKSIRSYVIDQSYAVRYTHCEIHPLLIFGGAAALTVLPNNTYGPRTTFASGQRKQAMGIYTTNPASRFDKTKVMIYPSLPIFGTLAEDLLRMDLHPSGTTVIVAEVIYSGFTQEDAVLANVTALQRGLFAYAKFSDYHTDFGSAAGMNYQWMNPSLKIVDGKALVSPEQCKAIGADGLPLIGSWVREEDVLIGKIKVIRDPRPGQPPEYKDASVKVKATDCGRVHSYMITPGQNGGGIIKVRILAVREPTVGDKLTDRCGQKATIGSIRRESEMPRTASGIIPDLLVNPHAIPSRMTVNKLIEMLAGKRACLEARRFDGSAFQELDLEDFSHALARLGFDSMGVEEFYSGTTGEPLKCRIYVGAAQYLLLKHNVMDKIQYRGLTGVFNAESKEPVGGTGKAGGAARMSELERQALITHGASTVILDRYCLSSNPFPVVICAACSFTADRTQGKYRCTNPRCRSEGPFGKINMKYSQYRISGLLAGTMVDTQYEARPAGEEQVLDLFRKAGFHDPPAFVKEIENEGKRSGVKGEEIAVGDVRVLLARKHLSNDGSYEVLATIVKYNKLLAGARDRRLRSDARDKIVQIGGYEYLTHPRRPTESYFLQLYGPEPQPGGTTRLYDLRRSIFVKLRRIDNKIIATTSLNNVWKTLREGRLTNPEEEMAGF